MLFSKRNVVQTNKFMVVIGTSPLAMFLVNALQKKGIEVVVLSSLDKKNERGNYVLKSANQTQNVEVNFCKTLSRKPEYCFLASSYEEYKNDLFFLSDVFLRDVPVINFASFYNKKIIEQMAQVDEIRAYFKGWLVKVKKEIYLLNRVSEVTICNNEATGIYLAELMTSNQINVKEDKNNDRVFWQEIAPCFLANLCLLAYKTDISVILADNEKRKKVDTAVSEIVSLLKKEKQQIDEQKILSDIYAFPDGYSSEFDSLKGIDALSKFVEGVDYFETPALFELVSAAYKKY